MTQAECQQLETLRAQFPDWWFAWQEVEPRWHAQRKGDHATRPAVITDLRATNPNDLALLLLHIPAVEPVADPNR
ncbi:hypothetical protein BZB76_4981 [Actinomadura pelletieri DSM 43383]|uniref:Uncharacterized protein n=1 Tax=Actinomadura pelletieri DSM 43383 TaxID=1120940 RepID=A0A495QJJ1_9ACTN|nr:hypothetical protein [Actinomadura pelletieri]RKS72164.1 hypothetical protein BZB76_4981 [Actinomadura pelletieri DSM 43383]